jgi:lipoprotein-anchoring transpeptidase ErfK/SrfK
MRRRVWLGIALVVGGVGGIGLLVLANQQGVLGGAAQRLLAQAARAEQQGNLAAAQGHLEELIATFPDSPWADDALLKLGELYEAQQQWLEARQMYQALLDRLPESPLLARAQERLGQANIALLFSPVVTDLDSAYEIKPGDTLVEIAAAHRTTVEFIQRANGLSGDLIRPGERLKVPSGRFSIVVDKSQNQLLLTENDRFVKMYPVSTGTDNSTPSGTFKIINRIRHPVWYKQGAVVPPDSPENILGTRWLGLDQPGYGIHGSVEPASIGQQVTAGCVRMARHDVEELFDIVPVGTEVTIVD